MVAASTTPAACASARHPAWADVPDSSWGDWRWQMRHRVTRLDELESLVRLSDSERAGVVGRSPQFSFAATPYYVSLFGGPACPVRRQAIPVRDELVQLHTDLRDPLAEEEHSPVEILSHRYPDRALLYVTHNCPVYCRHCTRQRKVGDAASAPGSSELAAAIDYLHRTPSIRDVLISGGDPLSLSDSRLAAICRQLRAVPSVEILRLCTRNPVTLPQRITSQLVDALRIYHPIYVNTHFNHPRECTPEAALALDRLADAGFAVGNQMVLLRGINDDAATVIELNRWLLRHRCRPYYMFQCDPVGGTAHLRTSIARGLEILDRLRGTFSGLGIPAFAVDLPGGGGKVTLTPDRLVSEHEGRYVFRDHRGREFTYHEPPEVVQAEKFASHDDPR
ncbi:MAG: KamA family radical SAM protein [Myxococcales bacterium FL481]|nr:MAG: KamA family radical SAM protein [Myxococcales bacterium FL481]